MKSVNGDLKCTKLLNLGQGADHDTMSAVGVAATVGCLGLGAVSSIGGSATGSS